MSTAEQYELNKNLAQMLKGGVIMDVTTPEQAKIAEEAGACAVMALERIPADIRAAGGVSRMSDPQMIRGIQEAVSIPVMAKCRIGHFVEAQLLEAIEIDYIDESEPMRNTMPHWNSLPPDMTSKLWWWTLPQQALSLAFTATGNFGCFRQTTM